MTELESIYNIRAKTPAEFTQVFEYLTDRIISNHQDFIVKRLEENKNTQIIRHQGERNDNN